MKHSINRIYHPYWLWEEASHNMWGSVQDRALYLDWAVEFTGNAELYGSWMIKVVNDWKYSCEHNLTNQTQNNQAWIGHAACAYANNCPEDIVRAAWSKLSEQQQIEANKKADQAIELWFEMRVGKVEQLCLKLD
jgi:hypothetical protein